MSTNTRSFIISVVTYFVVFMFIGGYLGFGLLYQAGKHLFHFNSPFGTPFLIYSAINLAWAVVYTRKQQRKDAEARRKVEARAIFDAGFIGAPAPSALELNRRLNAKTPSRVWVPKAEYIAQKRQEADAFYSSQAWRELRYQALVQHGAKCQCCGRGRKDGVVIHVDHIKPRSKHPSLALVLSNLQVLCDDCNIGKLNKDETDWR